MSDTLYNYVETTGVIVPDTSSILTEVQNEYTGVFGEGLNVDSSTPQGLQISAETTARSAVVQNNAAVANQINPNFAEGLFLDAICALTGLSRDPNSFTIVENVLLTGQPGATIEAGAQASTEAGDLFSLNEQVELVLSGGTGKGSGTFTAVVAGPIPCGAGGAGLVNVETDVLGWETVSNATAGTLGSLEQQDAPLRALRRNTLALQGIGLMEAILSAVNILPGVIGTQGLENVSADAQTISDVALTAKSIWVCVDGGAAADIATALLKSKSGGCDWNGSQTLTIVEPSSGQPYVVRWEIPTLVPLLMQIQIKQGTYIGNLLTDVSAAAVAFAANQANDLTGFVVGESASPFEMAAAIQQACPGVYIKTVQFSLASGSPSFAPTEIAMAIYQKATLVQGNIDVVVLT